MNRATARRSSVLDCLNDSNSPDALGVATAVRQTHWATAVALKEKRRSHVSLLPL